MGDVSWFDEKNFSVVRFRGKSKGPPRALSRARSVQSVLAEAKVSDDGTPPVELDALTLLSEVVRLLDSSLAGCTASFSKFYHEYMLSQAATKLLLDSFWYVSVCLFDSSNTKAAAALLKRLSRTYSVFMYSMPPGRDKDMFLQYFPYTIVRAIESAYRSYFPSSGSLYTAAFFDRVHALVSTLFVHDTGGGHGRRLREALREKLFNPKNGRGPPPPPLPDMGGGGTQHRMATDWSDIVCDEMTGEYHVMAKRGGGPRAQSPSMMGMGSMFMQVDGMGRPTTAPIAGKRSRGRKGGGSKRQGTAPAGNSRGEQVQWTLPGADDLVKDSSRPNSAAFELSNYSGATPQRSPLVGSYLRGQEVSGAAAVPRQFTIKRQSEIEEQEENAGKGGGLPVFHPTLLKAKGGSMTKSTDTYATDGMGSRPSTSEGGVNMGVKRAAGIRAAAGSRAASRQARKEQSEAHVSGLAHALGLGQETLGPLGGGEEQEKVYKRVTRYHAEAIRKERAAKRVLQREAEQKRNSVILGGRNNIKEFCYELGVQRDKEHELALSEGPSRKTRAGRRDEDQRAMEKLIESTIVHPKQAQGMDRDDGKHTVTNVFDAVREMGTRESWRRERDAEHSAMQHDGTDQAHMLYDPTRFKNSKTREEAMEAGGGVLPPRTRPTTMRDLRRTHSKEFRIGFGRSEPHLPFSKVPMIPQEEQDEWQ